MSLEFGCRHIYRAQKLDVIAFAVVNLTHMFSAALIIVATALTFMIKVGGLRAATERIKE